MKNLSFLAIITAIIAVLCACASDTEQVGLSEIANFYGCTVDYSKGISASTEDVLQGKHVILTLKDVDFGGMYQGDYSIPASHSAYLFYKNLSPTEKNNYAFIRVITETGNSHHEYNFDVKDLALADANLEMFDKTVDFIKSQNYHELISYFHPFLKHDIDSSYWSEGLTNMHQSNGEVTEYHLLGFEHENIDLDTIEFDALTYYGILVRAEESNALRLTIDLNGGPESILGLNLE